MPRRCRRPDLGVGSYHLQLAQPPRPAPPAFHKKGNRGDAAPLGCHPPMDKEHHRASLKSQRENTAATPAVNRRICRTSAAARGSRGRGLDGLLRNRAERKHLTGILTGVDESWNPQICPELVSPFEVGDWRTRQNNTLALRRQFALAISRGPLFGLVAAPGTAKGNRPRTISRRKHRCCRRSSR